jgi:hypothetical protein
MQQLCAPIVRSHFRIWHEAEGHGDAAIASENGGLTAAGEQPSGQHANYAITLTLVAFGKLSVGTYMASTVLPFHMASKNKLGDVDKSALTNIHPYGKFAESGSPRSHEELDETRVRSASACDNRQNLSGGHSLPRTHPLPRQSYVGVIAAEFISMAASICLDIRVARPQQARPIAVLHGARSRKDGGALAGG